MRSCVVFLKLCLQTTLPPAQVRVLYVPTTNQWPDQSAESANHSVFIYAQDEELYCLQPSRILYGNIYSSQDSSMANISPW